MRDEHFPLHLYHCIIDDFVTAHGAVMSDNKELVNVGDFVATSDLTVSHVTPFLLSRYKNLLILGQIWCFADMLQRSTLICSLLRELKKIPSDDKSPILNDFEYPLFLLTDHVFDVATSDVVSSVSMVHCCSASCGIIEDEVPCTLEREVVQSNEPVFRHDFIKNFYGLNIYSLSHYIDK